MSLLRNIEFDRANDPNKNRGEKKGNKGGLTPNQGGKSPIARDHPDAWLR